MGLITKIPFIYYEKSQAYIGDGLIVDFTVAIDPQPVSTEEFDIKIDDVLQSKTTYTYSNPVVTFTSAPAVGERVVVELVSKTWGEYRYISLVDIVNNYMFENVGPNKKFKHATRRDIIFQAKQGIKHFSFDASRTIKTLETEVSPALNIIMPQDYVDYIPGGIRWVDNNGIEHPISLINHTPTSTLIPLQDDNYENVYDEEDGLIETSSIAKQRFEDNNHEFIFDYTRDYVVDKVASYGGRFGGDPQYMNRNGGFYVNEELGLIHFTSDLADAIITVRYVSDSLGTDNEVKIHKYTEQALYAWISFKLASSLDNFAEYEIRRFEKRKTAEYHNAKIRLSKMSPASLSQVMKGMSKQIKH